MKANVSNIKKYIPNDFRRVSVNCGGIPLGDKTYFLWEDSEFDENGKKITFCNFSTSDGKCEKELVKILSDNFELEIVGRRFHYTDFEIKSKK